MNQDIEKAFVELIQDHAGIIFKVIDLYIEDDEDRKDVYQEILIQCWKSYSRFKGQSKFSTWLYKVALNTVLTWQKKENRRKDIKKEVIPAQDLGSNESTIKDELYLLVKSLNEIDRMIMTLHLDGYQNIEIAEITGIKTNNINVKLYRLKKQIIEQLKTLKDGSL